MASYGTSITCQAGAAITKRRFVKISAVATNDAVCKVIHCAAATDWPIGISYTDQATVNDNLTVHTAYNAIREIEVGSGGVTADDNGTSDADGKVITASAGDNYMCRILTTALEGDLAVCFIYGSEVSGLFTGDILAADGTVSLPSVSFADDPDCGRYRIGANNIGDAVNGAKVLDIGVAGLGVTGTITPSGQIVAIAGTVGAPGYAIAGELDCGFYLIGAGNVGLAIDGAKILDVDGSGINGIIGATTPAAGVFTTLGTTGAPDFAASDPSVWRATEVVPVTIADVGDVEFWAVNDHPKAIVVSGFAVLTEVPDASGDTIIVQIDDGTNNITDALTFTEGSDALGAVKKFTVDTAYDNIALATKIDIAVSGNSTTLGEVTVYLTLKGEA